MLHGHRQRLQQQEVEQRPALRASHPSPTHRKLKDSASERNVGGRSQSQGAPNWKKQVFALQDTFGSSVRVVLKQVGWVTSPTPPQSD